MKYIVLTMLGFFVCCFWAGPLVAGMIYPDANAELTWLVPLYVGMVLLAGILVGCTVLVLQALRSHAEDEIPILWEEELEEDAGED